MVSDVPTTDTEDAATSLADAVTDERLVAVDDLSRQFMRFGRMMKRVMTQLPGPRRDDIELAAYILLAHVVWDGPKRTTALADAMHADTSTVSRQTAALVRHGLLERRPDPADGRASILAATPEGEAVFREKNRQRNTRIAQILANWHLPEIRQLITVLDRLNADLEAGDGSQQSSGGWPSANAGGKVREESR